MLLYQSKQLVVRYRLRNYNEIALYQSGVGGCRDNGVVSVQDVH